MPRPEYPSDHRRYFRVMEDILEDAGYRSLSAHSKVAWIDLLAMFNRQKAQQTGNTIVLPWSRAKAVMAAQNNRGALRRCSELSRNLSVVFARVPEGLLCHIPNYAKYQGLATRRLRAVSVATPLPTPTPTPTPRDSTSPPLAPKYSTRNNEGKKPRKKRHGSPQTREVWPALVEAAAKHGKRWSPEPSKAAADLLDVRIRSDGLTKPELVAIIDGAPRYWARANPNLNVHANLIPETLFRPRNWAKYLDAASEPAPELPLDTVGAARSAYRARIAKAEGVGSPLVRKEP